MENIPSDSKLRGRRLKQGEIPYFSKKRSIGYASFYGATIVLSGVVVALSRLMTFSEFTYVWAVITVWTLLYIFIFLPVYIRFIRRSGRFIFFRESRYYGFYRRTLTPLGKEPLEYGLKPYGILLSYFLWILIWLAILLILFIPALAIFANIFGESF